MECLPSYKDSLYLEHHGVLGQKWGIRRYQNKDGSLTSEGKKRYSGHTIKKGTELFRISDKSETDLHDGFYAGVDKSDHDKYLKTYAKQLSKTGKEVVDKTLIVTKDLQIPSKSTSKRILASTLDRLGYRDDSKTSESLKEYFRNDISKENNASDRLYKKAIKDVDTYVKTGKVGTNLHDALNVANADRRSKIIQDISTSFYDDLDRNGYGAVKDLNDSKYGSMKTTLPLIIAKSGSVRISEIKEVSNG